VLARVQSYLKLKVIVGIWEICNRWTHRTSYLWIFPNLRRRGRVFRAFLVWLVGWRSRFYLVSLRKATWFTVIVSLISPRVKPTSSLRVSPITKVILTQKWATIVHLLLVQRSTKFIYYHKACLNFSYSLWKCILHYSWSFLQAPSHALYVDKQLIRVHL
jgi:hypothetical protein